MSNGGDFGTAKYLSKKMKAKGLQKLKFYCQICLKQCRDENGFKQHIKSPSHLAKISKITKDDIDSFSIKFEKDFLRLLRLSHGEKKIEANKFYNEFIQDKDHTHMNATRFTSLSKFIQHLSKTGKVKIYGLDSISGNKDIDMGTLMISYIDTSSENLLHKQRIQELESSEKSEQEVRRILLEKQISQGQTAVEDTVEETPSSPLNIDEKISIPLKLTQKKSLKVQKKRPKKNIFN
ncbi:hypothetical protein KAFR_0D02370 [Kazachstania africana CBS 2517]|uniref:C2H2-type domain-containing protein n=1 Tax=Kazachstania africana (strain ATCC 22294 / BCRC 22015 / CBS 2517 / CECT 1963 / NBRC 1671 / NRRL Y-8276) TaxID=1071382 RepID=H2AU34_KAZAF|nr:hypothetical protein KAFR_0D02370 [Kazachstania africana CBS 2517]CCF57884.1 hypothetical protein KAFR_0D02370 [Kazachstania africana CBS 2517]